MESDLLIEEDDKERDDREKLARIKAGLKVDVMDDGGKDRVYAQLNWTYPHEKLTKVKAKQTVTELKRQHEVIDEQSDQLYGNQFRHPAEQRPRFLQKSKMTAAERGTAMHTFMQHMPFQHVTPEQLQLTLDKLVRKEILTEEQARAIDLTLVAQLTETALFQRIQSAQQTHREIPFAYTVPPFEGSEEKVIIQGVIDLVLEEEDGLVIVDYKTDAITGRFPSFEDAKPTLKNRYEIQLNLYEQALERIWNQRVKAKFLYFFDGSHVLEL